MKTSLLFASTMAMIIIVATDDAKREKLLKIKRIHNECQADPATKIEEDAMVKLFKDEPIDESKYVKHILCMNIKTGIQKENGDIDKDGLKRLISGDTEKVDEVVEDCGERKGGTAEDAALALFRCLKKHKPRPEHRHHDA